MRLKAMQYLQQRGCFHPEAATRFRIGYANRTLGYRLPPHPTQEGDRLKAQLQKIGILRESGHEHLNGCVIFPITHEQGHVVEMYGRRITKPMPGVSGHLYLPGPHGGVWNWEELKTSRQWLLCEAGIDALSFWAHGFRNVTWSYGVNGFTPDHWKLLREVRPERVIICYDNDEAGNRAANELAQQLEAEGIEAWRVELKPGTDINDLARGPAFNRPRDYDARNELASLLAGAVRLLPVGDAIKPRINTDETPISPVSQAEAVESATADSTIRDHLCPSVAAPLFRVSEDGRQATFTVGERSWRVRGLDGNTSFDHLKINLRLQYRERFHLHTFDLYNARARTEFIAQAQEVTGADKAALESDLAQLIVGIEMHQEKKILEAMKPVETFPAMTPEEEMEAMKILTSPHLLEIVTQDMHRCGMAGEDNNLPTVWLVSLSRKLDRPLGVCVMSRSAAGKSTLLEAVAQMVPEEDRHQYTALTPQALFHMPENALRNKVLFIAEDVGAEGASYSLKNIQSDGKLIIACTTKDEATGQMVTKTKIVHGPVAVFLTSTNRSIDDELLNRLLVLTIDESPEQTRRIHEAQRRAQTLEGILERRARPRLLKLHQNIQRLIRPLVVRNPFTDKLKFSHGRLRSRRDFQKYIDLINVRALAHQYQRPIASATDLEGQTFQCIEVTEEDIAGVDALLATVMDQTTDERTPAARRMLVELETMTGENPKGRWTRRQIRERTGWSDTQVRMVLEQLVDLEYVLQWGQGRGNLVTYQLADLPPAVGCRPSNGVAEAEVRTVRTSSQSPDCEVVTHASSLAAAALAADGATSQSFSGVRVREDISGPDRKSNGV